MREPFRRDRRPSRPKTTDPPKDRATLEAIHGRVWNTGELGGEFVLLSLSGSALVVRRIADNVIGVLTVQTGPPQFFFDFKPNDPL